MGEFQPKHPWMNGIQVCSYEGPRPFPERNDNKIAKNTSSPEPMGQFNQIPEK